jgi:diguanylate cyclase (GGDEF)-like protein
MSFYSVVVYKAEQEIIERFKPLFIKEGFSVTFVDKQEELFGCLSRGEAQLAILDLENGEEEELSNLKEIKFLNHESMVLLLASTSSMETIIRALQFGASDYIFRPIDVNDLISRVRSCFEKLELRRKVVKRTHDLVTINKKLQDDLSERDTIENELRVYQDQLVARTEHLEKLCIIDPLTNITNRRGFAEALKTEWNRATRDDDYIGLILLDVDYFKKYNDTYGHQAGDVCLKQIAASMVECLRRPADLVARYGGEEFVVILPSTPPSGVKIIAEQIKQCIEDLKIDHSKNSASNYVTASLGVACGKPFPKVSYEHFLAAADGALYKAKDEGRNQFRYVECNEKLTVAAKLTG